MKYVAQFLLLVVFIVAGAGPAAARQDGNSPPEEREVDETVPDVDDGGGGFSAEDRGGDTGAPTTLERPATLEVIFPPANPIQSATLDRASDAGDEEQVEEEASPPEDTCLERAPSIYNEEGDFYYTGRCIKRLVCGAERVDDVASGDIAGEDIHGRYRAFLGETLANIGLDSHLGAHDLSSFASVNDFLIAGGLGDRPSDDLIPVFYWCAGRDEDGVFDPIDPLTVSFGWDLVVDDVYDIPAVRANLYIELLAKLDLYDPQVGMVPPADNGYTYVQWPTWMFLENPLEHEHIYTTNDVDTFRVDLRASLISVDWRFDDELVASCTAEQMMRYDADLHHPIDDLPPCHHIFTALATQDLTTTISYRIEEQVRSRASSSLDEYPEDNWVDYLGAPTVVELSTTLDDYEVHPILSVNVADGVTADELRARAGDRPRPGD